MTDYLIEAATKEEWAERALRAEAKLQDMALDCLAAEGQAADAYQAQLAAEAKLAKAFEMLKALGVMPIALAIVLAELKQGTE